MRKSLKKIRQSITGEKKKDYDLEITCRFLMTEEYNEADTVLCYAGTKDEIDTRYLIYAALANHKRVGLPRCNGDILDFYKKNENEMKGVKYFDEFLDGLVIQSKEYDDELEKEKKRRFRNAIYMSKSKLTGQG